MPDPRLSWSDLVRIVELELARQEGLAASPARPFTAVSPLGLVLHAASARRERPLQGEDPSLLRALMVACAGAASIDGVSLERLRAETEPPYDPGFDDPLDVLGTWVGLAMLEVLGEGSAGRAPLASEVEACLGILRANVPAGAHRGLRAFEVVVAAIGGDWCGRVTRIPTDALGWNRTGARALLDAYVSTTVTACLYALWAKPNDPEEGRWHAWTHSPGVIGFPELDPEHYAPRVSRLLRARQAGCHCWELVAATDDPTALRGNGKRKFENHLRRHHLSQFKPAGPGEDDGNRDGSHLTLWAFLQMAVKGSVGPFWKAPGSFPSSILWWLLQRDADAGKIPRLMLVKMFERYCDRDATWTTALECPRCKTGMNGRPARAQRGRLIAHPEGGFTEQQYWLCDNPDCVSRSGPAMAPSVYDVVRCAERCSAPHDRCPQCDWVHAQDWSCLACGKHFRAVRCRGGCTEGQAEHDRCPQEGCGTAHPRGARPRRCPRSTAYRQVVAPRRRAAIDDREPAATRPEEVEEQLARFRQGDWRGLWADMWRQLGRDGAPLDDAPATPDELAERWLDSRLAALQRAEKSGEAEDAERSLRTEGAPWERVIWSFYLDHRAIYAWLMS